VINGGILRDRKKFGGNDNGINCSSDEDFKKKPLRRENTTELYDLDEVGMGACQQQNGGAVTYGFGSPCEPFDLDQNKDRGMGACQQQNGGAVTFGFGSPCEPFDLDQNKDYRKAYLYSVKQQKQQKQDQDSPLVYPPNSNTPDASSPMSGDLSGNLISGNNQSLYHPNGKPIGIDPRFTAMLLPRPRLDEIDSMWVEYTEKYDDACTIHYGYCLLLVFEGNLKGI